MSNQPEEKKNFLLEAIASIIAILGILIIKPSEKLKAFAYGKSQEHHFAYLFSYIIAVLSLFTSAYHFQQTGMSYLPALFSGLGISLLNFHYIWPALYLVFIRSAFKLWEHVDTERFWSSKRESWFTSFLLTLGWLSAVTGDFYIGYAIFSVVSSHLGSVNDMLVSVSGIAIVLALVAGFGTAVVAGLAVGVFYFFTGIYFLAFLLGLIFASSSLPYLQTINAGAGLTGTLSTTGTFWLATLVFVAYVFPAFHIVMTHGFKWVNQFTRQARQLAYAVPGKDQQKENAFMVLAALPLTAAFVLLFFQSWMTFRYTFAGALLLSVVSGTLLFNYLAGRQRKDGIAGYGLILSFVATGTVFVQALSLPMPHLYGVTDVMLGVLAGLLTYNLAIPYLVGGAMLVGYPLLSRQPGSLILRGHDYLNSQLKRFWTLMERFQNSTYTSRMNEYSPELPSLTHLLILHASNIALAVVIASLCMSIPVNSLLPGVSYAIAIIAGLLSYLVIGSYLLNGRSATDSLGFVASTLAATGIVMQCWGHGPGYNVLAFAWGTTVWLFVANCAFPVLHTGVRALLQYKFMDEVTEYLVEKLSRLYLWFWSGFEVFWGRVRVIFDRLVVLLGKFFGRVAALYNIIAAQIGTIWRSIKKKMDEIWASVEAAYRRWTGGQ